MDIISKQKDFYVLNNFSMCDSDGPSESTHEAAISIISSEEFKHVFKQHQDSDDLDNDYVASPKRK
ncbi:hypothetical protein BGZ54_004721, partial [Gamsiella multidivaricata]